MGINFGCLYGHFHPTAPVLWAIVPLPESARSIWCAFQLPNALKKTPAKQESVSICYFWQIVILHWNGFYLFYVNEIAVQLLGLIALLMSEWAAATVVLKSLNEIWTLVNPKAEYTEMGNNT